MDVASVYDACMNLGLVGGHAKGSGEMILYLVRPSSLVSATAGARLKLPVDHMGVPLDVDVAYL